MVSGADATAKGLCAVPEILCSPSYALVLLVRYVMLRLLERSFGWVDDPAGWCATIWKWLSEAIINNLLEKAVKIIGGIAMEVFGKVTSHCMNFVICVTATWLGASLLMRRSQS